MSASPQSSYASLLQPLLIIAFDLWVGVEQALLMTYGNLRAFVCVTGQIYSFLERTIPAYTTVQRLDAICEEAHHHRSYCCDCGLLGPQYSRCNLPKKRHHYPGSCENKCELQPFDVRDILIRHRIIEDQLNIKTIQKHSYKSSMKKHVHDLSVPYFSVLSIYRHHRAHQLPRVPSHSVITRLLPYRTSLLRRVVLVHRTKVRRREPRLHIQFAVGTGKARSHTHKYVST